MVVVVVLVAVGIGAAIYFSTTRPCESGYHRRRHWKRQNTGMW